MNLASEYSRRIILVWIISTMSGMYLLSIIDSVFTLKFSISTALILAVFVLPFLLSMIIHRYFNILIGENLTGKETFKTTRTWISDHLVIFIGIVAFAVWSSGYFLTGFFQEGRTMYTLFSPIDSCFGFFTSTVFIYLTVYMIFLIPFAASDNASDALMILISFGIMLSFNYILMLLWPVEMIRPSPSGTHLSAEVVRLLQKHDVAHNCFPSSHCSVSLLAGLMSFKKERLFISIFTMGSAIAISLSTLTTKQHFAIDVISGWILALTAWAFIYKSKRLRAIVSERIFRS
ncbi:phosphatase PAP2 family protein [Myxococcota bacterium]|nr:phosphatase PAP2 family protein [Myxococcota bacterium]MBU1382103.1 phosphatase PAP2 family protein [Myxococcota bacterium]MBU1498105.1 phosphatase PAP2 family protein [Myxococcota bacterium]